MFVHDVLHQLFGQFSQEFGMAAFVLSRLLLSDICCADNIKEYLLARIVVVNFIITTQNPPTM